MTTELDYPQCIKGSYIGESQMLRTGNALALEVSIQDGATIGAITDSVVDVDGTRNLNIHALVGADTLSTAAVAKIQYSPSDTDSIWIDTGLTLTSGTTPASVSSGTAISTLLARRIRLYLNTAPVDGDVTFYVVGN